MLHTGRTSIIDAPRDATSKKGRLLPWDPPVRRVTVMSGTNRSELPEDLIDIEQLMRVLAEEPDSSDEDSSVDTQPVPKITHMPEGIEVVERHLGHAVGHWVLQVRCDCGRRWFEVEPVKSAECPRCGALVLIQVESRQPPSAEGDADLAE